MFIDTHAHIYLDRFEEDLEDVINRAKDAKVNKILLPNIDLDTAEDLFNCCNRFPKRCFPMLGLHPCSVDHNWKTVIDGLKKHPKIANLIAIGETGIDLYWDKTFHTEQIEAFEYQIQWAKDLDLPIVIHSRSAIDLTIGSVAKYQDGTLKGIFHCFDQDFESASKIIDLNFFMGIGGVITYKKNEELRRTLSRVPLGSIVLETDAPYLPPVPYRGKRNESSYIPIIAEQLAQIHNKTVEEVAEITSANALQLFNI